MIFEESIIKYDDSTKENKEENDFFYDINIWDDNQDDDHNEIKIEIKYNEKLAEKYGISKDEVNNYLLTISKKIDKMNEDKIININTYKFKIKMLEGYLDLLTTLKKTIK
ncbi:MAG: hypothetical protein NWE89_01265 [Candidatus Bathyarchaeota archaeon]|nr:hypothetical protein [Candidatus Bathyarchaeota archaeon]